MMTEAPQLARRPPGPSIIGIPKRSVYSDVDEGRAITGALRAARGVVRPTPVAFGGRIIGFARGEGVFSSRVAFEKVPAQYRMAWSGYNSIIESLSNSRRLARTWAKTTTTAMIGSSWYDLWPVDGFPGPGSLAGAANTAIAYDNTVAGTLYMGPAVSPLLKTITSAWGTMAINVPTLLVYDRVLDYQNNAYTAAANQNMTNVAVAGRYNGAGLPGMEMVWATNTVHNATAVTITVVTYVDNAGNPGALMPTTDPVIIVVSGAAPTTTLGARVIAPASTGNVITWGPFLPLAAGTIGARSVTNYTTSAANTGTFELVLVHPLVFLPITSNTAVSYVDNILQIPSMERLYDGAAVCALLNTANTNANIVTGGLDGVWG